MSRSRDPHDTRDGDGGFLSRRICLRCFFSVRRFSRCAREGRVLRRGLTGRLARSIIAASRRRASTRLRYWLRLDSLRIVMTPS